MLVGLYAGTPRTEQEIEELIPPIQNAIPHERDIVIDHLVEDFFDSYKLPLEEFCFRSGWDFEFRPLRFSEDSDPSQVLTPQDHNLLDTDVVEIKDLMSASRLFQTLLTALGESTCRQERSFKEAFLAGVYQMQQLAQIDASGIQQLNTLITQAIPLVIGHSFTAITQNTIEYSLGCEPEQIPLHTLMSSMQPEYAQQLWSFQSALLFHEARRIQGVAELDVEDWHRWVADRAEAFKDAYSDQLVGFSQSGNTLNEVPIWGKEVNDFNNCDAFINSVWGLSFTMIRNRIELLEYKALIIHVVYASLTMSKEEIH